MAVHDARLNRRGLLRSGLLSVGALAFGPGLYRRAFAAATGPAQPGPGPYGALGAFDERGIALPPGFTSREIARAGTPVAGTGYPWHTLTDGQATFPTLGPDRVPDGGWVLVANSEVPGGAGGASSVRFAADGRVVGAQRILGGTSRNCAGGPTPQGTWLSCEEHEGGVVWECDPLGEAPAVARPALGTFQHEAVCVDPTAGRLYLTEDRSDGCLYRFTPTRYPDLSAGLLEVAIVAGGVVAWEAVPFPNQVAPTPTRHQVPGATVFYGGEGIWFDSGVVYFTTKNDRRVWAYDTRDGRIEVLYDAVATASGPLVAVDNVTVSSSGDVYVCEDGDDFEVCLIAPDREVAAFLRLDPAVHGAVGTNETVGVVFDPSGTRMYFGVQRSFGQGVVYEVTGPFRQPEPPSAPPRTPPPASPGPPRPGAEPPPAGDPPPDRIAPSVRLRVPARLPVARLLREGLPVTLDLDEPVGVEVYLRAPGRRVTIARAVPTVALRDRVLLRLRPTGIRARRLRGAARPVTGELTVVVSDRAGNRTVARRPVRLTPQRRRRPVASRRRR